MLCVLRSRMEDVKGVEAFDFICARAIGKKAALIRWSRERLAPNGRLVLFLGEDERPNSPQDESVELGIAHKDTQFVEALRSVWSTHIVTGNNFLECSTWNTR